MKRVGVAIIAITNSAKRLYRYIDYNGRWRQTGMHLQQVIYFHSLHCNEKMHQSMRQSAVITYHWIYHYSAYEM